MKHLFICQFISLLATFWGGWFFSAITQYVSSATLKSGRCHFLQFIDGGSWGPENKAQAFEFPHCFLAVLLPSPTVTNAQGSAAASQEESLLPRIYLHGKEVTNETSKLIQKGLLQTADSWTRLDCSGQTGEVHDSWIPIWSCYSHYSSSCLLSYHLPMPPLEHCTPDHRHTHPLPLNSAVPKQHEVGTPMSSSGKSMNLKAVHAAGPKKRN